MNLCHAPILLPKKIKIKKKFINNNNTKLKSKLSEVFLRYIGSIFVALQHRKILHGPKFDKRSNNLNSKSISVSILSA